MRQIIPFCKDIVFKTNIASITSISLEHEEKLIDEEVSGDFIVFGDYKIHNDTTEKELFKYRLPFTALIPDNIIPESVDVDVENFTYEQIEEDVLKVNIDFSVSGEEMEEVKTVNERYEDVLEGEGVQLSEDVIKELNNEIDQFVEKRKLEEKKGDIDIIESISVDSNIDNENDLKEESVSEVEENDVKELKEKVIINDDENVELNRIQNVIEKDDEDDRKLEKDDMEVYDERPMIVDISKSEESVKEEIEKVDQTEIKEVVSEYVTYHIHIINDNETVDGILKKYGSNMEIIKEYNDISNIKVGDKIIIPEYIDE